MKQRVPTTSRSCRLVRCVLLTLLVGAHFATQAALDPQEQLNLLTATNEPLNLRLQAARTLGELKSQPREVLQTLVDILLDKSEPPELRQGVVTALRRTPGSDQAVPALMVVLKDRKEPIELRTAAMEGYARLAQHSTIFLDDFAKVLRNDTEPEPLRDQAASVLAAISGRLAEQTRHRSAGLADVSANAAKVRTIFASFEETGIPPPESVSLALKELEERSARLSQPWLKRLFSNPAAWVLLPLLPPALGLLVWLVLLWRAPLALWKWASLIRAIPELKPKTLRGRAMSVSRYLLIHRFQYHPKVLDAWLAERWEAAARALNDLSATIEADLDLPVPLKLNQGRCVPRPAPADFRQAFQEDRVCLAICGPNGAGKTSFAVQMAKWAMADSSADRLASQRMLPLFISLDPAAADEDGANVALEAIQRSLCALGAHPKDVTEELVSSLFALKRFLVIFDGLVDQTDGRTKLFALGSTCGSLLKTLVVTSRTKAAVAPFATFLAELMPIEATSLPEALALLVRRNGALPHLSDREILSASAQALDLFGERPITPLWAELYASNLCHTNERRTSAHPPTTLFDLVLGHLNHRNHRVSEASRFSNEKVHALAQKAAWECVKAGQAGRVQRAAMLSALGTGDEAVQNLEYLCQKLRILQGGPEDHVRFRTGLDGVVELLAAKGLIDSLGPREAEWRNCLSDPAIRALLTGGQRTFLETLRDCILEAEAQGKAPAFLEVELGRLAGLDGVQLENARLQRQVNHLISQLSDPEPEQRKTAAQWLGEIGLAAIGSQPHLLARVTDPHEQPAVILAAIAALREIGVQNEEVALAVLPKLHAQEPALQLAAARTLAGMGNKAVDLLTKALDDRSQSETCRLTLLRTLSSLAESQPAAASALLQVLREPAEASPLRLAAADALARLGPHAASAVPALVRLMREDLQYSATAARVLIAIAPAARSSVISFVEAITQRAPASRKEILKAFRPSLLQGRATSTAPIGSAIVDRVQRELASALDQASSETHQPAAPNEPASLSLAQ